MKKSKILHDNEFFIKGIINFAPYAKEKKNIILAIDEPTPNIYFSFPENCWETDPIKITVSK